MKKILGIFWIIAVILVSFPRIVHAEEIDLKAKAAILIDAETGQVLYEKNAHQQRYPASITKIMTTYLAVEYGKMEDILTASDTAIDAVPRNTTHIALNYGETLSVQDALYASMLVSANETCNVLAEYISGSMEKFADLMNETANLAGAVNTHFNNANGLPDENHRTTAYDMAMITRYAMKNEKWNQLFKTESYAMPATNMNDERQFVNGHQMLLSTSDNYYKYAIGGKIGWTGDAQYTMVTVAQKDGMTLIAVILGCETGQDRYDSTLALFEYGFSFRKTTFLASQFETTEITLEKNSLIPLIATLTLEEDIPFLISPDIKVEEITYEVVTENEDNEQNFTPSLNLKYHDQILRTIPLSFNIKHATTQLILSIGILLIKLVFLCLILFILLILTVIFIGKKKGLKMKKFF